MTVQGIIKYNGKPIDLKTDTDGIIHYNNQSVTEILDYIISHIELIEKGVVTNG